MHVHDLNPKKTLVAVILFVLIIIIGFLTLKQPRFEYKLTMQESIDMLKDKDACFYPWQLADVLSKVNGNVILVDLRDKFSFSRGHIPGAENISAYDLTDKGNINHLKQLHDEGMTVVLYGNDQLQANGPFMWFRQLGYNNVKILLGGYLYYEKHKSDLSKTKNDDSYILEKPDYNYAEIAKKAVSSDNEISNVKKKTTIIKRRKKTKEVSGGC